MSAQKALSYVESLGSSGIKFALHRIQTVLKAFGNPHTQFKSIHIAGTNGKGSVAMMIAKALVDQDYRVGLYTSPHLLKLHERFQVNLKPISNRELEGLIQNVKNKIHKQVHLKDELTQFEFLTVLAFVWFQEKHVDVAVIETGLGGRLDATNVLDPVLVSVITTIGRDHMNWLGTSLKKIAWEKAGIIKHKTPILTGAVGSAQKVIQVVARSKKAPFTTLSPSRKNLSFQKFNAALSYEALKILSHSSLKINLKKSWDSIRNAKWPGRFEVRKIDHKVFVLDGAHNTEAVKALLRTLKEKGFKKFDLIFGALRDKPHPSMISLLSPHIHRCLCVPVRSPRSSSPRELAAHPLWRCRALPCTSLKEAIDQFKDTPSTHPVLLTGSLYLIGEALKFSEFRSGPAREEMIGFLKGKL